MVVGMHTLHTFYFIYNFYIRSVKGVDVNVISTYVVRRNNISFCSRLSSFQASFVLFILHLTYICCCLISKKGKSSSKKQIKVQSTLIFKPQKESAEGCVICEEEDPPGRSKKVDWVDCDVCKIWAHLRCAKESWENIRRNSWLCTKDCKL